MRTLTTLTLSLFLSLTACTSWSTETVLGPKTEVSRQLRGMPSFATSSQSSTSAGFAAGRTSRTLVAGLDAGTQSFTRTHCVQDAEVTYEQPFELHPKPIGRSKDLIAGIALTVIGLSVLSTSMGTEGDGYYAGEPSSTGGMIAGGAVMAGGVGLLVYSYTSLPKQPRPEVKKGVNRWVATEVVEAQGCASPNAPAIAQNAPAPVSAPVPAAAAAPPANPDVTERLRTLDRLKASGTISNAEYQRKRAEILDGI